IAAEAAGVPRRVFERWLHEGEQEGAPGPLRDFVEAIQQAQAQARLGAEVAARNERPMDWLRSGPGKQTAEATGWTGRVRGAEHEGEASLLLDPEVQATFQDLVEALGPFPDARAAVARVLAGKGLPSG